MEQALIPLSESGVRRGLAEYGGIQVKIFEEIDSTNTEAKRLAQAAGCPTTLLAARAQTAGRGRLGRDFYSPAGTGLYMTLIWRTDKPLDEAVSVTAAAAVAASRAIRTVAGVETGIKWVNDLYRSGGKICGILTEAVTPRAGETYLAAGWGINLTTAEFPSGLRSPAGCLLDADSPRRAPLDVGMLCGQIARELLTMLNTDTVTAPATLEEYRRRLTLTGQSVRATRGNEILEGVVRGVDSNFGLIVETPDGIRILHSGEVSVRVIAP